MYSVPTMVTERTLTFIIFHASYKLKWDQIISFESMQQWFLIGWQKVICVCFGFAVLYALWLVKKLYTTFSTKYMYNYCKAKPSMNCSHRFFALVTSYVYVLHWVSIDSFYCLHLLWFLRILFQSHNQLHVYYWNLSNEYINLFYWQFALILDCTINSFQEILVKRAMYS